MTKSKGIGRGGRRKGAGRPRFTKTGKTEFFTTRITPKTRNLLEAEAKRCGESLSIVAEGMLLTALEKRAEVLHRSRKLRALFFLIERLAIMIRGEYGRKPPSKKISREDALYKYSWVKDPYMFEAFRVGVVAILEALRPAGDVVKPPGDPLFILAPKREDGWHPSEVRHTFPDTPSEWGDLCAYNLIFSAMMEGALTEYMEGRGEQVPMRYGIRTHYGYINAGRDLNLAANIAKLPNLLGRKD